MFLAEAREHLQQLNLAIVRLEEDPNDRGTVDEIFRIAHSLKGMSATMGFSRIAELTHEMEDVFELLRQRSERPPGEAIDTVLACLDALSAAFESIETDGEEALDPAPLVERLRSLVRPRTPEQEMARVGVADPLDHAAVIAAQEAGRPRAARRVDARRRGADAGRARAHGVGRARRPRRAARQRARRRTPSSSSRAARSRRGSPPSTRTRRSPTNVRRRLRRGHGRGQRASEAAAPAPATEVCRRRRRRPGRRRRPTAPVAPAAETAPTPQPPRPRPRARRLPLRPAPCASTPSASTR